MKGLGENTDKVRSNFEAHRMAIRSMQGPVGQHGHYKVADSDCLDRLSDLEVLDCLRVGHSTGSWVRRRGYRQVVDEEWMAIEGFEGGMVSFQQANLDR